MEEADMGAYCLEGYYSLRFKNWSKILTSHFILHNELSK